MPRISKKELEAQIEALCKKRVAAKEKLCKLDQQWDKLKEQYIKSYRCPVCGATSKDTRMSLHFDFMWKTFWIHCCNCGCAFNEAQGKTIHELRNNLRKHAREVKKCQDSDHQ